MGHISPKVREDMIRSNVAVGIDTDSGNRSIKEICEGCFRRKQEAELHKNKNRQPVVFSNSSTLISWVQ